MPEKIVYAPGTPNSVYLGTSDLDTAISFYRELFGWEARRDERPEAGGYTQMMLNGKVVAGAGPLFLDEQPTSWSTYISVADADEAAHLVTKAGGTVLMEPMDVFDAGRMAFVLDPTGAAVGIWQPGTHIGAELVGEPGTLCWNELTTRDIDTAKAFYGTVFGWRGATADLDGMAYTTWELDGTAIAGMVQMNEIWPAELPSHWMIYFAVADTDAAAAKAAELGGKVSVPPTDITPGRFAVLNDPQGAFFSVITMRAPQA
jgi:predicted enzyme related to lactoylglutathione lyase